jgi:hypothetical protein
MKLEQKHLAPYLPYGLKIKVIDTNFYKYDVMTLCDKSGLSNIGLSDLLDEPQDFKPILHPLSDLKKGFHKDFDEVLFDDNNYVYTDELGIKATPSIELFIGDGCNNTIIFDSVIEIYYLLLKHHFDVFRLIQKGLAIDINTLNK